MPLCFMFNRSKIPDIIAIQEAGTKVKLPGYKSFQSSDSDLTAILVQRNLAADLVQLAETGIQDNFIEVILRNKEDCSHFILNVYSKPRAQHHRFHSLLEAAKKKAARNPLLIVGDFNAPHTSWGYSYTTKKGRMLWEQIQKCHLTPQSDPFTATRIGTSVQRDTSPDLTLSAGISEMQWTCTEHTLGSDHYIIQSDILSVKQYTAPIRHTHFTDWNKFRKIRDQQNSRGFSEPADLENWTQQLIKDA